MRKLILLSVLTTIYFFWPNQSFSQSISGQSASITYNYRESQINKNKTLKKLVIQRILDKHNSPLVSDVDSFIDSCNNYDLNCYLLPSITGLESSFGRFTYPNSYNPFGWGGGYIMFDDWQNAINTVGKGLRENYINKGAQTIDAIGSIYAESPTWSIRVKYFLTQFEAEEKKISLLLSQKEVEL